LFAVFGRYFVHESMIKFGRQFGRPKILKSTPGVGVDQPVALGSRLGLVVLGLDEAAAHRDLLGHDDADGPGNGERVLRRGLAARLGVRENVRRDPGLRFAGNLAADEKEDFVI
jgi:hypothetical protein